MHIAPNTFQVNEITYKNENSYKNGILVENIQNPIVLPHYPIDTLGCDPRYLISYKEVSLVVASQFTDTRVSELRSLNQGGFELDLCVNQTGVIKYIAFKIGKNGMLTPLEIYKIEKALVNYQLPTWNIATQCPNGGNGYFFPCFNMGVRPRN